MNAFEQYAKNGILDHFQNFAVFSTYSYFESSSNKPKKKINKHLVSIWYPICSVTNIFLHLHFLAFL